MEESMSVIGNNPGPLELQEGLEVVETTHIDVGHAGVEDAAARTFTDGGYFTGEAELTEGGKPSPLTVAEKITQLEIGDTTGKLAARNQLSERANELKAQLPSASDDELAEMQDELAATEARIKELEGELNKNYSAEIQEVELALAEADTPELHDKLATLKASQAAHKAYKVMRTLLVQEGLSKLSADAETIASSKAHLSSVDVDMSVADQLRILDQYGLTVSKKEHLAALEAKVSGASDPKRAEKMAKVAVVQTRMQRVPRAKLMKSMTVMHRALAPHMVIKKTREGFKATNKPSDAAECREIQTADAAIIMGSNDIRQVDSFFRNVWSKLPKAKRESFKIYISGFGGHGTMSGPIFGHTEASSMAKWLFDLGVPQENIIIEPNATNSGENVQFIDDYFDQQPEGAPKKVILSGTPAGCLRQSLTLIQQSRYGQEFESVIVHPSKEWKADYFAEGDKDFIYALSYFRELGSYVVYSINSPFIAPIPVFEKKEKSLENAIIETLKYYNKLSGGEISTAEMKKIAQRYVKFQNRKAKLSKNGTQPLSSQQMKSLKEEFSDITAVFNDVNKFFRETFAAVEDLFMERIPRGLTHDEHSKELRLRLTESEDVKEMIRDTHERRVRDERVSTFAPAQSHLDGLGIEF